MLTPGPSVGRCQTFAGDRDSINRRVKSGRDTAKETGARSRSMLNIFELQDKRIQEASRTLPS